MNALAITSLLVALAGGGYDSGWVPEECPQGLPAEWGRFEKEVRKAIPSSTLYVPKPFPLTEADVLKDLRHQYFRIWGKITQSDLPKEERPLVEGFRKGSLRFQVMTVINWTPVRCLPKRPTQFSYLIRILNKGGEETARFALERSGLWSQYVIAEEEFGIRAPWEQQGLPSLPAALSEVKSRYGIEGARAQYVYTVAGTVRCDILVPCIAFQARGKMYVLDRAKWGGLYEFTADTPGLSVEEIKEKARRGPGATAQGVDTQRIGLLSVGNRWVYARKVPVP